MKPKSEQILVGGGLRWSGAEPPIQLHVDPSIASSNWVLLRGRIELPRTSPPRPWFYPGRKTVTPLELTGTSLEVRLPDDDEPRAITIGPDGSFEARFVAHLPRLRSAQRTVVLTLRHFGELIDRTVPLFMPSPGATLGVIVLTPDAISAQVGGSVADHAMPGESGLSECSRELTSLLSSRGAGNEPNSVFYLQLPSGPHTKKTVTQAHGCPAGLAIPVHGHSAASAVAVETAQWIGRITELFANELEFVVVADTNMQSVAALRALSRLDTGSQRLRAVFLNDTRPVSRGVRTQVERPTGIEGLELPIVLCRTLDEARRAAATCGLIASSEALAGGIRHSDRRYTATHTHGTRYPLVFCHGMLGYSVLRLRQVDLTHYFRGVREFLSERGFRVLMPQLGRTHSIEQRADQLHQTIGRWTSEPVNIIAHSMGGLDSRFLISKLGMSDRVVSLTTIASPHHGSTFADWFIERFDAKLPFLRGLEQLGLEVDGFRDCTRAACRVFNQVVPDSPKVRYFSYSAFQVARKIPPVLRRSHSLIARSEGANDGLVSEISARWGEHMATLRADHLSLVGERGPEYFDHLAFFTRIVDDLVRQGF